MPPGWLNKALDGLPGTDDAVFRKLWDERRLLFEGREGVGDRVDDRAARMIAAALRQGLRLLVVLPDFRPHRPSFLFATALICHALNSNSSSGTAMQRRSPVLYFGATVGIRDQLRRTSVRRLGLNLADVFCQQDVSRGAVGMRGLGVGTSTRPSNLARVITVYAPADPVTLVRAHKPCWIAVDCDDAPSLTWLRPLLEEASRQNLPTIAWGQNPLAESVSDFACFGDVFVCPPHVQNPLCSSNRLNDTPEDLLLVQGSTSLTPLVLDGKSVDGFSNPLREASQVLCLASQHLEGAFRRDVVAIHWKYLRSLETLAVPAEFYEAEAARFWGLKPLGQLRTVCDRFREACLQIDGSMVRHLNQVASLLYDATASLERNGCALWDALTNLSIEDPSDDEVRILVFSGNSRKRLFLLAMLARHNTTEDDLRKMRVYVASLNELRQWVRLRNTSSDATNQDDFSMPPTNLKWSPILVGLLSPAMTPRLLGIFLHPRVEILLYPHQCPSFLRRKAEWSARLGGDIDWTIGTLARLSGLHLPSVLPSIPERVAVEEPIEVNVETTVRLRRALSDSVWQPQDTVNEVANLFQLDEAFTEEELVLTDQAESNTSTTDASSEDLWCAEAVRVQFDQGWRVDFSPDDEINIVRAGSNGNILDRRYVRSLKVGDRVILIHGQQRQSLYDLIISRVHKHPSIELHLALIRRWQEDLRVAFQKWQRRTPDSADLSAHETRDMNGLLRQMQRQGSQLISTLTLSLWLKGLVLCPLDPEDLRRVAEVLDISFVRQYRAQIIQAATRLRGLHRSLSLKLNRWLVDHAMGAPHKSDDDVIDVELGLTFGDVRSSLLVLSTVRIERVRGPFLRSHLGRAEKDA